MVNFRLFKMSINIQFIQAMFTVFLLKQIPCFAMNESKICQVWNSKDKEHCYRLQKRLYNCIYNSIVGHDSIRESKIAPLQHLYYITRKLFSEYKDTPLILNHPYKYEEAMCINGKNTLAYFFSNAFEYEQIKNSLKAIPIFFKAYLDSQPYNISFYYWIFKNIKIKLPKPIINMIINLNNQNENSIKNIIACLSIPVRKNEGNEPTAQEYISSIFFDLESVQLFDPAQWHSNSPYMIQIIYTEVKERKILCAEKKDEKNYIIPYQPIICSCEICTQNKITREKHLNQINLDTYLETDPNKEISKNKCCILF